MNRLSARAARAIGSRGAWAVLGTAVATFLAATPADAAAQGGSGADTASRRIATAPSGLIPAGFGSLRREDIEIVAQVEGLTVRAMPLDESVIRTLAPDSYQNLHALRESRRLQIDSIRKRLGVAEVQAWYVAFFNVQQGEARYDPRGIQIRSAGRDFRPFDVLALVLKYDDGRLGQGKKVDAIFVFDMAVALDQPLVVTLAGQQSAAWADVLPKLERERAAIWSRAAATRRP